MTRIMNNNLWKNSDCYSFLFCQKVVKAELILIKFKLTKKAELIRLQNYFSESKYEYGSPLARAGIVYRPNIIIA